MNNSSHQIGPPQRRHRSLTHDRVLRTLILLLTVPALTLYAVDTARFAYTFSAVSNDNSFVVDVLGILFCSLYIARYVFINLSSPHRPPPYGQPKGFWISVAIDWIFSAAFMGMGCTSVSMRGNPSNCANYVEGCASWLQHLNKGIGGLMITGAIGHYPLYVLPVDRRYRDKCFSTWGEEHQLVG